MTDAAQLEVTLPTGRFLLVIGAASLAAGAVFAAGALILGLGGDGARNGVVGAAIVAVVASLVILGLRPWRPRSLMQWPVVWVAGSFVRLVATFGGTYLLYSATQLGGKSLWMAGLFAYLAVMVGENRVYVTSMKRFAPGGAEASTPE